MLFYKFIENLLYETNWFLRRWFGGACYDRSTQSEEPPPPASESCYTSINDPKLKYLRELVIDLLLVSIIKTNKSKTTSELRRDIVILLITENRNFNETILLEIDKMAVHGK